MPFTVTMPKLSPTMEKGTIAKWHKAEGEFVDAGDLIVEIATDKATIEYNALDSGWLRRRLLADGSEAAVNEPIAIFTEEESESIDGYAVSAVNTAKIENQAAPQPLKPNTRSSSAVAFQHVFSLFDTKTTKPIIVVFGEVCIDTLIDFLAEDSELFDTYTYTKDKVDHDLNKKQLRFMKSVHSWLHWECKNCPNKDFTTCCEVGETGSLSFCPLKW